MGKLHIDTSTTCYEKKRLLRTPISQLPEALEVEEETARVGVEEGGAKRYKRYGGLTASDLPSEVWGRVFEFLASSDKVLYSNCGSCDRIISIMDGILGSYWSLSQVCKAWHTTLRGSRRISPEVWHRGVFGLEGGQDDVMTRVKALKSYQSVMKELHQSPAEKRRAMRGRVEKTIEKVVGLKWMLQMEFAGLFWNHEQPPVEDLMRLEGYCNDILSGGEVPTRDDELCTTVDDAIGNNALVHEYDASKFIVLFMSKRQRKEKAKANVMVTPPPLAHQLSPSTTTPTSGGFHVVFDQIKGWRRDNSIKFTGCTKLVTDADADLEAGGLLGSLPWDVQMEFGNCNLCSSHLSRDREVFCLFSLSNYSGHGRGTELLLLARLPQFSFHDDNMTTGEGFTCSMPIL